MTGRPVTPPVARTRQPTAADAPALSRLVALLGYPAPAEVMPGRLENVLSSPDATVLVAENAAGEVVGVVATQLLRALHSDAPLAWVTILVVLDTARGQGIGSFLLDWAEEWARGKGATKISLSSGAHRLDTHRYYDNRGYERSGIRFTKQLTGKDK